jgi:hypothetical protein
MADPSAPVSSTSTTKKTGRRSSGLSKLVNLLLLLAIIGVIGMFVRAEMQRRDTAQRLETTKAELEQIKKSTTQGGEELAKQVLERVGKLIVLPTEPAPTVATIVDIERLREANEFYSVADNGDHLIITDKRAILFDPDRGVILDVVPVVIDETATSPSPGGSPGASPVGSPGALPTASPTASPIAPR